MWFLCSGVGEIRMDSEQKKTTCRTVLQVNVPKDLGKQAWPSYGEMDSIFLTQDIALEISAIGHR